MESTEGAALGCWKWPFSRANQALSRPSATKGCVQEGSAVLVQPWLPKALSGLQELQISLRTTVQNCRKCLGLTFSHNQKIPWQRLFLQPPPQECRGAPAVPGVWGEVGTGAGWALTDIPGGPWGTPRATSTLQALSSACPSTFPVSPWTRAWVLILPTAKSSLINSGNNFLE